MFFAVLIANIIITITTAIVLIILTKIITTFTTMIALITLIVAISGSQSQIQICCHHLCIEDDYCHHPITPPKFRSLVCITINTNIIIPITITITINHDWLHQVTPGFIVRKATTKQPGPSGQGSQPLLIEGPPLPSACSLERDPLTKKNVVRMSLPSAHCLNLFILYECL